MYRYARGCSVACEHVVRDDPRRLALAERSFPASQLLACLRCHQQIAETFRSGNESGSRMQSAQIESRVCLLHNLVEMDSHRRIVVYLYSIRGILTRDQKNNESGCKELAAARPQRLIHMCRAGCHDDKIVLPGDHVDKGEPHPITTNPGRP